MDGYMEAYQTYRYAFRSKSWVGVCRKERYHALMNIGITFDLFAWRWSVFMNWIIHLLCTYQLVDLCSHRYVSVDIVEFFSDRYVSIDHALHLVSHFPHRLIRQGVSQGSEEGVEERHAFGEGMTWFRFIEWNRMKSDRGVLQKETIFIVYHINKYSVHGDFVVRTNKIFDNLPLCQNPRVYCEYFRNCFQCSDIFVEFRSSRRVYPQRCYCTLRWWLE